MAGVESDVAQAVDQQPEDLSRVSVSSSLPGTPSIPMSKIHQEGLLEVDQLLEDMKKQLHLGTRRVQRADTRKLSEKGEIKPEEALYKLMEGHRRFLAGENAHPHQSARWLQMLTDVQRPFAAVLSCSDSRAPPEMLFDCGFGDIFVCRVAGNIATNEEIGSLEYSVADLGASLILVMGHEHCGACKTALTGKHYPGYIDILVDALGVPVERACALNGLKPREKPQLNDSLLEGVVMENIRYQIERLMKSAVLSAAVKEGTLKIVGGYYNFESGHVSLVDYEG